MRFPACLHGLIRGGLIDVDWRFDGQLVRLIWDSRLLDFFSIIRDILMIVAWRCGAGSCLHDGLYCKG